MAVPLEPWLDAITDEYLSTYIRDGGSAVRFVVMDGPDQTSHVASRLRRLGADAAMTVLSIDAAQTRLHLLQNVFFAIAQAVPWDAVAQSQLERIVNDAGYRWPTPGQRTTMELLAKANEIMPNMLDINKAITRIVWNDALLAQDFRHAVIALLQAKLLDDRDTTRDAVMEWLHGTLRRIGQVKEAGIGAKINRSNARAMLKSLAHWLHTTTGQGFLLIFDIGALLLERREVKDGLYYSPAAVMDCYEVLRQLIDDSDGMEGFFMAVLADRRLLDSDTKRSLTQYTALNMRLMEDVRPERGSNLLAPLVLLQ